MKKLSLCWLLAGSFWSIAPVYAQTSDCDQIRAVKKMANQKGLDDSTLSTLEAQYCGVSSYQDCDDLTVLHRLASLSGTEGAALKQINKKREAACSSGAALGSWSGGSYVRDGNNLFYPSGNYARNGKTWYYANGNTARNSSDQWYYPNGNVSNDSKKNWYDPNGNSLKLDTLLSQSCDKVSESFCSDSIRLIKASTNEGKLSAIVQFAWVAWNTQPSYDTSTNTGSADCSDLNTMHRLASLSSNDKGLLKSIATRQKTACASGLSGGADWSTGYTAKYNNGSWNYPNGTTAKYTNGSWNYADGTTAKYTNGSWNYPNGTTARYSNGNWNDPSGGSIKAEDLLLKSCERLSESDCSSGLSLIKSSSGDEKILAILEFSLFAWSQKTSPGSYAPPQNTNDNSYGSTGNQDCTTLDFMGRVALLGGGKSDLLGSIEKKRKSVCASGTDTSSFSWSNGLSAKSTSGAWSYPNGITARSTSGAWSYPNGVTAKSASGAWSYPSGITARSASGSWSDPSGNSISADNLLTKACNKLSEQLCNDGLQAIKSLSGDDKIFGMIEFSYTAWSYSKGGY